MGLSQSSTSTGDHDCSTEPRTSNYLDKSRPQFIIRDFEYHFGKKLESFPESAQRLFSLSKGYFNDGLCHGCNIPNKSQATFSSNKEELSDDSTPYRIGLEPADVSQPDVNQPTVSQITTSSDHRGTPEAATSHDRGTPAADSLFTPLPVAEITNIFLAQTFSKWKSAHTLNNITASCFQKRSIIYIQPIDHFPSFISNYHIRIGNLDLGFFELLQGFSQIFFSGLETLIREPVIVSDSCWRVKSRVHQVTKQKQYRVNDIHMLLRANLPHNGVASVGVSWTDIYPQGFNFVLGEASACHRSAVLSFGRFETKGFDPETHQDIMEVNGSLIWKMFKILSHETCHLLDISHCHFFNCAMNESHSVSQAMNQPLFLCPVCLRKLQEVCQFDPLERYLQLRQFLQAVAAGVAAEGHGGECGRLAKSLVWLDQCIDYISLES